MSEDTAQYSTPGDIGDSPHAIARRWKLELKIAGKRESAWRKRGSDILKAYTPETPAANSFNILWSNTETLRQAVYNSLPQPDVRRRYNDPDPLGKAVATVLTRALEFAQDVYDFDAVLKGDVLAMLLPGRAVSRVKYIPDIGERGEGDDAYEELDWETVICERVQWDDLRMSAGKTWEQICWVAFRHRLPREELIEKFGEEIGAKIPLDASDDDEVKQSKDRELFKTAEVWEIWDKEEKEVVWICPTFETPCKTQPDPMGLQGFYPIPKPLYAIESESTMVPAALFTQYEQQARELNRISVRINKLVDALRVRGVYDASLSELSELMKSGDNDLIPSQNVTALLERGGLEKAIWMLPIETLIAVLQGLYVQRDQAKQTIYELTGISDIMRSASDPQETFGAQKIKTQWGTQRLQRMQKEVQRYIRDLLRLKAEIISEKFQPETLEKMTLVKLPHQADVDAQKAQQAQQYQMAAMQAQQAGKQPPPPPQQQPNPITWEAVVAAMQDDATRTYRIDIESDSTIAATQDSDMAAMRDLLQGVGGIVTSFAPAVERGAIPIEAVKEIILAVTRRAKMGSAVEDALEKMKEPSPPPDPNAGKAKAEQAKMQAEMQMRQAEGQQTMQLEQMKMQMQDQQHQRELQAKAQSDQHAAQLSMQVETHKQQMQAQQIQAEKELEAATEQRRMELEAQRALQDLQHQAALEAQKIEWEREKAQIEYRKAIEVAEIGAATTIQTAQASAAAQGSRGEDGKADKAKLDAVVASLSRPRKIVRGADGKVAGIE